MSRKVLEAGDEAVSVALWWELKSRVWVVVITGFWSHSVGWGGDVVLEVNRRAPCW